MPPPVEVTEQTWAAPGVGQIDGSGQRRETRRVRTAWWLWPHLLSLDAPLVAVTWQLWWASAHGVSPAASRCLILALAVWMIYLADRLADVSGAEPGELLTDRHAFYARHSSAMKLLLALVIVALMVLTPILLPLRRFFGGLGLLGATGIYYWTIHHARRPITPQVPKEAVVGAVFSVGTIFFVACGSPHSFGALCLNAVLFAVLCFLNCGLISTWERSPQDIDDSSSLLTAFPNLSAGLSRGALALVAAALALAFVLKSCAGIPIAASAAGLWLLDRYREKLSPAALRILADCVLLTPLLGLCWPS